MPRGHTLHHSTVCYRSDEDNPRQQPPLRWHPLLCLSQQLPVCSSLECTAIKGGKCCDGFYFIIMILVLASFDVILTQARVTGDEGISTEKIHIEHFL